jgi:hypothetical protein
MPVIEKMRIAAAEMIKNALGITIMKVLPFAHLNKRVAIYEQIKKDHFVISLVTDRLAHQFCCKSLASTL